jgi:hypothetical protein
VEIWYSYPAQDCDWKDFTDLHRYIELHPIRKTCTSYSHPPQRLPRPNIPLLRLEWRKEDRTGKEGNVLRSHRSARKLVLDEVTTETVNWAATFFFHRVLAWRVVRISDGRLSPKRFSICPLSHKTCVPLVGLSESGLHLYLRVFLHLYLRALCN